MNQTRNILFSTTRQWNPGDEFILMGVLNLMRSIADFNPVIFNRSPEIQRSNSRLCFSFMFDLARLRCKRLKPGRYDNSFKDKFLDTPFINLAVFAGTSEWASRKMRSMYEYIDRQSIPAVFLGIGAGTTRFNYKELDPLYRRVLEKARLITVRDNFCREMLGELRPFRLPCPALAAAPGEYERDIKKVSAIGLIFGVNRSVKHNSVDDRTYRFQVKLYRKVLMKYAPGVNVEFVCHYVDELPQVRREFGNWKCNYSYDARDYLDIYNKFDLVIGPRVHGIGLAASMGIPGINIHHDIRSSTCDGFRAAQILPINDPQEALVMMEDRIEHLAELNKALLAHKHEVMRTYYNLLLPVLSGAPQKSCESSKEELWSK